MAVPVKVSDRLLALAKKEAESTHRSATAQIEHWATLGRAIEVMAAYHDVLALKRVGTALPMPAFVSREAVHDLLAGLVSDDDRASVKARIRWLIHPANQHLIDDELVLLRMGFYSRGDARAIAPMVNRMLPRHDEFLVPLERIRSETLLLWTRDNPIHDLDAARATQTRIANSRLYVMAADSCHWPQYEAPGEFNDVTRCFFGGRELPIQ